MKSLLRLTCQILLDAGLRCGTDVSRDLERISCRYDHEGESFLTISLPAFCAAFENALAQGQCASVPFPGFRKRSGFPLFLGGMLRQVFTEDGLSILDDPSIDAIQAIRQVCLVLGKLFEVCDVRRERATIEQYVQCELELEETWFDPDLLARLGSVAARYFGHLSVVDERVANLSVVPRHGPGSTADGLRGNAKFDCSSWSEMLEDVFPASEFLVASRSESALDHIQFYEPGSEPSVKVVSVPKTAVKARIIAMEPTFKQYAQQALLREMMAVCQNQPIVDLNSQDHNRDLARRGSENGQFATLDLSEASDRVHLSVVEAVFSRFPHLLAALKATRSATADVPGHGKLSLAKFASMGSAVCFPVESIVFAVSAIDSIEQAANGNSNESSPTMDDIRHTVRVFGDDIIVPTRYVHSVVSGLAAIAARPNPRKSFWTGRFRESCGGEYYAGEDVTVARLRRRLPRSPRDAREVLALIAFRNHLYMRGFWGAVKYLDEEWLSAFPLPIVEETSPIVGRWSIFQWKAQRFHQDFQSPLVWGLKVLAPPPPSICSEEGMLLKCLLPDRFEPFEDVRHLMRAGRPRRVRIKAGWGQPF